MKIKTKILIISIIVSITIFLIFVFFNLKSKKPNEPIQTLLTTEVVPQLLPLQQPPAQQPPGALIKPAAITLDNPIFASLWALPLTGPTTSILNKLGNIVE